ncbi:DUF3775 domain-containing protein [Cognatishimia activa]|uniref:DUF3775 domain-containing protein n=1 Tax=Cognatishimia activa TaxID=1715691 RepID=UPI002230EF63|nr:DUF3775 domain-containing protein [Cognatishimia activa]UZD90986.1 DUF3775 domain-containing protein [Cognatishimia activa]
MLEITPWKVAQVVLMGRELDRAEGELRGFFERLTDDEMIDLVAIMWIGRESFEPGDLVEALRTARDERTTPSADYLLGTPHLSDHLENGMDSLGISLVDAEDSLMSGR